MNNNNMFVVSVDIFTDGDAWCADYDSSLQSANIYLLTGSFKEAKEELSAYLQNVIETLNGRYHVVRILNEVISDVVELLKLEDNYFGEYVSYENEKEEFLMDIDLGNQNVTISIQEVSVKKTNSFTKFVVVGKEY